MIILIAFEDQYRAYKEAIASVIEQSRPNLEVVVADLGELPTEMERLDPELVICGLHSAVDIGDRSRVELALDPERTSRVYVNQQQWELSNPSLEELLSIVDEAEKS